MKVPAFLNIFWDRLNVALFAMGTALRAYLANPKKQRQLILAALVIVLGVTSFFVLKAGGTNAYDMQAIGLVFVRLNMWVLTVVFYQRLMAALGDDDVETDWDRINAGNVAVSVYRAVELIVIGGASALLISKV